LDEVKVSVVGLAVSPVLPVLATLTVTVPDGAADSDTPNTPLVPDATENVGGLERIEPEHVPVPDVVVSDAVTVAEV
jgi:hypothetical protein